MTTLSALAALWRVPGTSGVLLVAGGLEVLTGALHILIVVLAGDTLDMGRAGAGVLSTFGGIGAALALPVSTVLLGRTGLAPALLVGSGVVALAAIALGVWTTLATALVLLPIMGCSMLVTFLVTRMLLQRSVPPAALAATFGVLELIVGLSQIIGTFAGQALIALAGPDAALIGLGVFLAVLLVGIRRRVRSADDVSDVPVVAMSLLRRIPAFEPLPATELEAVARGAVEMSVSDGAVVVCEGGRGDCVFGVADGHFDVTMDGELVRTLGRGDGFGEIALLADVARTATVTARGSGTLLSRRTRAVPDRGDRSRLVAGCGVAGDPIAASLRRAARSDAQSRLTTWWGRATDVETRGPSLGHMSHLSNVWFKVTDLQVASGQGCRVTTVDGVEYLDFAAGIAVNSTGHSHPRGGRGDLPAGGPWHPPPGQRVHPRSARAIGHAAGRTGTRQHRHVLLRQLGRRDHRGGGQAGQAGDRPAERHRVLRVVPRADAPDDGDDDVEDRLPIGPRAVAFGHPRRPVS